MILAINLIELDNRRCEELQQRRKMLTRIFQGRKINRLVAQGKRRYGMPNKGGGKSEWDIHQIRQTKRQRVWGHGLDKFAKFPE